MSSEPSHRQGNLADDLPYPGMRPKTLSPFIRAKERLQFTGWLQFIPPFAVALVLGLVAWLSIAPGSSGWIWFGRALAAFAVALVAVGLFDLALLKFRLFSLPDRRPRPVKGDDIAVMRARRACRSFQPVRLTNHDMTTLTDLVTKHLVPRADNISNARIRIEHLRQPLPVWPVIGAREFLILIVPGQYDRHAVIKAGRVMQHVVNGLTKRGISTCWIGPGTDRASVEAALGGRFDASDEQILCSVAVGYGSRFRPLLAHVAAKVMHRRLPLVDLAFEDVPGVPAPLSRQPYKGLRPALEACRWAPSSYNSQTTRVILSRSGRALTRVAFCAKTGSRYYAPLALGIWLANWETAMSALGIEGHFVAKSGVDPVEEDLVHDVDWIADN
ncbi:nitroreductase family protein [Maritimibacter dapengensis]|uniref:Nitroreductase family protein n=1 Tax=Maritimibacter dapengensis TaxID=2836868 RepID=A0ABS6T0E9_9RHOB|nr:nitroreductase family protein [Maritimibacter dapengensis]MBV7378711.1 nitroreductase family protein [Maritimibacter dapengensis]